MESNREQMLSILDEFFTLRKASLIQSQENTPLEVMTITFDLSTTRTREQAFPISFPHKCIYVSTNYLADTNDTVQGVVPLKSKDVLSHEFPKAKGYLYWSAQSGKSISLVFFVKSDFKSGSFLLQNTNASFSSYTTNAVVSVSTTAVALTSTGNNSTFYNDGAHTVYVGSSGVTGATGLPIPSGSERTFNNSGTLYGITSSGTSTVRILSEA